MTTCPPYPARKLFARTAWMVLPLGFLMANLITLAVQAEDKPSARVPVVKGKDGWISLFDGKTLKGWEKTNFGGEGDVSVKDGAILMEVGSDLTGVHTHRKLPKINYEVELEAQRVNGSDFFCGLTFPVKEDPCSLIVGGWGGGVCGLSSIDDLDASENDTTTYQEFQPKKWYKIRLKVTEKKIEAWIDGKPIVDQDLEDKKISIRYEVELSKPFGFACWQTTAALRNIRIRSLEDVPQQEKNKTAKKSSDAK